MDDQKFDHLVKNLKDHINAVFFKHIGSDEYKDDVVQKSNKSIKDLKIESQALFESGDFEKLKKSKLSLVGTYQTSKHSSHHILSFCNLNNAFVVTGHSDSTFKIWYLSPSYFQTPFANASIKAVSSKDLVEEDFSKSKKTNGVKPFELVYVSHSEDYHKHYVTAVCAYERSSDKRKILASGDASGELIISEIHYHAVTAKLERVDLVFRRRGHTGQISKIEKLNHDDIIVTASHDGSVMFWDIEREQKLMHLTEHDSPIQSLQFMDDYAYMCTATKNDLIVWSITMDERNNNRGRDDDQGYEQAESRFTLRAKVINTVDLEDKGSSTFSTTRLFGTNMRYDYLLFVSLGSDIKIMNVLKGKYIGDIDGAHFKGTTNFGVILNGNGRLKSTLSKINNVLSTGNQKELLGLFVEQLNDYILFSCSSKDKIRAWRFDDASSTPVCQASALGGSVDNNIMIITTRAGETCVIICGSCSNKIEVFTMA